MQSLGISKQKLIFYWQLFSICCFRYYLNGRNATGFDFIDPTIFDVLHNQINVVKNVVATVGIKNKHIWLGNHSIVFNPNNVLCHNRCFVLF